MASLNMRTNIRQIATVLLSAVFMLGTVKPVPSAQP